MSSSNERSKWKRTQNPLIWKDQQGNVRDMTSNEPDDYKNGEGFRISSIIQLRTFLPKNVAGVNYNDPYRYRGNNPKTMYIDNEHMLLFLNDRIGKLCDEHVLTRTDCSKKFKGVKYLFANAGENLLFSEIQKLFCAKTCLYDPVGYHKVCGNHITFKDIAEIDPLANIPGFLEELSLYDEFIQKPFPCIDLELLNANSGRRNGDKVNDLNHGIIGQYEAWKFLIVLISLYTCLKEKIDSKIGSFTTSTWSEGKLLFRSSHVGKQSGLAPPPLAQWGWGPKYTPVDNPCTEYPPCNLCVKDHNKNNKVESHSHWMNFHYRKEECPGFKAFPGSFRDHLNPQSHKKPEYINGKYLYYCNIGGCPEECKCSDCMMEATVENNTQCKLHVPDHPENFDERLHIQYSRKMFTEKEVQKEFLPMKLPKMEKSCDVCQKNVFQHRFYHRSHHSICNACVFMKDVAERSFENICKFCAKIFKDKYKLKNHLGVHEKIFMCDPCDKQFACKQTLKKHTEEFHTEKKMIEFRCTICDVKCSNRRNLLAHEKTHQPPSSINKCVLCHGDLSFKQARNLRRHYISIHMIVPEHYFKRKIDMFFQHTCNICGKKFDRKSRLDKHKENHTCSAFSCLHCKFYTNDECDFTDHLSKTHLSCDYCDFKTIFKWNLRRHVREHK